MGIFDFLKKSKNTYVFNGPNELYHNNGKGEIRERFNRKNGKIHGQYKFYNEHGQLISIQEYIHGEENGLWKIYHKNGQILYVVNKIDGEENGIGKYYHENGQLESEGMVKNGNEYGLWKYYDQNGKLTSEKNYDENGKEIK